ncbi:hypothetical protein [Arcobacter arenosus]|jgi:hypothetical protein|uniref:Uncharacterized protein n=1 Tax=Arcobacter arenosus TaxID=2576037 RepID=A0A5R8Y2D1_9BACT|nr:hypothetical protein [Arcobacter arenosus]TLP39434.1 hypothetical protein FDK22_06075 [Arcobacter arenosus]
MKRVESIKMVKISNEEEHQLVDHFNDMSVQEWACLPIELKFPAPKHIYQMKIEKHLTWKDLEQNFK